MNDIEAIHAIEVMLAEEEICRCFDFAPIELAALSRAIAALKAKSDAEVAIDWADKNRGSIIKMDKGGWLTVSGTDFAHAVEAPTLADLAKKIGDGK